MFFWNSLAFLMIQLMLAFWCLVPLPFLNQAWTSGSSRFAYYWSLEVPASCTVEANLLSNQELELLLWNSSPDPPKLGHTVFWGLKPTLFPFACKVIKLFFLLYPKLSPRFSLASVHRGWSFGMRISLSVLMKRLGGVFIGLHWIYWSIWGELMFQQYWVSYPLTWSISIYLDHLWFLLSEFYSFSLRSLSLFLRQCNFKNVFLAALSLCCCRWTFSSCEKWRLLSRWGVWASHCGGLSCGVQAVGRMGSVAGTRAQ